MITSLQRCLCRAIVLVSSIAFPYFCALAQDAPAGELHVRIAYPGHKSKDKIPPAVVWLQPRTQGLVPVATPGHFTLLQKDRTFVPHLLIIPAGSIVSFPNADPFFHNVFSLFNGKRFDLGLYEAGASREVLFSREGVSYIFCNIHSEMSAVVIALKTPLFAVAGPDAVAVLHNVPPGDYELHVWVEGVSEPSLNSLSRRVHVRSSGADTVTIDLLEAPAPQHDHLNEFGQPYDHTTRRPY
jgi:hypothetical protein